MNLALLGKKAATSANWIRSTWPKLSQRTIGNCGKGKDLLDLLRLGNKKMPIIVAWKGSEENN
jgi:hypothetical protein